jgi:hypothetical protein
LTASSTSIAQRANSNMTANSGITVVTALDISRDGRSITDDGEVFTVIEARGGGYAVIGKSTRQRRQRQQ